APGAPAASLPADAPFTLEEGFVRLDDGKDLEGFEGDKAGWSVRDGAIDLDAKAARGDIYSTRAHSRDVIIRLQFRATPGADSGLFVYGKQLQVPDSPAAGPKKYAFAARPAGQWNDLEFDVTRGVAKVKLNGQVIEEAWKIGGKAKKGVGLQ